MSEFRYNDTYSEPMQPVEVGPINSEGGSKPWYRGVMGLVAAGAILVGGFYLGNNYRIVWAESWPFIPEVVSTSQTASIEGNLLYAQVEQLMRTKYLGSDKLDDQEMLFGAISGMVASAGDPYTAFFDPEQSQASEDQLSGRYSGIGAELGYNEDRQVVVIAPIADTPAERAGVRAGDLILAIDETSTKGMTLQEVVSMIRGEADTEVVLTVQRASGGSSQDIAITRQQITIKSVTVEYDGSIAHITLSRFGDTTTSEWDAVVSEVLGRGVKGVILDMRNNPGGYLETAIHIGSEFFADGHVVGQEDATGKVTEFPVSGRGRLVTMPVTVLINGGSASASEIVAGAIKARDRGEVIGQTSFGKGSVQQVIDLPYKTSLHVTVARWILPDGTNIDRQGIEPSIEVELTEDDFAADRDPQLERAKQSLR